MDDARHPATSHRFARLMQKLRDESYRHSYMATHTRQFLARQMRAFRGDASQTEFAATMGVPQSVISQRYENPNYGKWTLSTLFEIAAKRDVAVLVRFVDWDTFVQITDDMSEEAVCPKSYTSKPPGESVHDVREELGNVPTAKEAGALAIISDPAGLQALNVGRTLPWPQSGAWLLVNSATSWPSSNVEPTADFVSVSAPLSNWTRVLPSHEKEVARLQQEIAAKDRLIAEKEKQLEHLAAENAHLRSLSATAMPTSQDPLLLEDVSIPLAARAPMRFQDPQRWVGGSA